MSQNETSADLTNKSYSTSARPLTTDSRALSYYDDGLLHLWECPKLLGGHNPDFLRCGYIATGSGHCPYDHGERVRLVEIVSVVQCSDCGVPIERDECRAPDNRLICGQCVLSYIGKYPEDESPSRGRND